MSWQDFLGGLFGTGLNIASLRNMQQALGQFGQEAYTGLTDIGREAQAATEFRPFTVTTGLGGVTTTPEGGITTALSPQQQALQTGLESGAFGMLPYATARPSQYAPFAGAALGQAQQALGQAMTPDLAMALQRAGVGSLFGGQLGQIGMPTGLEGITGAALMGGQQRVMGAAPSQELLGLSNLFGGNVGTLLAGQPSRGIGDLASRALSLGTQGLGGAAPADIEGLRQQYAGLAGQAAGGLLQPRGEREQDIYERIRAVQTPEEERQRLALEGRLAGQGRLGVQTAQFGGTPEQLALAKAQEEAQNQAALMALQQAGTEQQQAFQQALGLAGQTGQLAGTSSQLQSAAQQRAAQLSQLGLSAEQIQSALESEGLGRAAQAAGISSQLRQASSGLESQALQRGLGLSQLGLAGTQAGAGLEAQRLQQLLGLQQADIGAARAQQALQQGGVGLAGGLFGLAGQAAGLPSQLQAGDIANLQNLLQTGYAPQAQLLNALQPAINLANIASTGQRQGAGLFSEAAASGLQAQLNAALQAAEIEKSLFQSIAGGVGGADSGGLFGQLLNKLFPTAPTTTTT